MYHLIKRKDRIRKLKLRRNTLSEQACCRAPSVHTLMDTRKNTALKRLKLSSQAVVT